MWTKLLMCNSLTTTKCVYMYLSDKETPDEQSTQHRVKGHVQVYTFRVRNLVFSAHDNLTSFHDMSYCDCLTFSSLHSTSDPLPVSRRTIWR